MRIKEIYLEAHSNLTTEDSFGFDILNGNLYKVNDIVNYLGVQCFLIKNEKNEDHHFPISDSFVGDQFITSYLSTFKQIKQ